MKKTKFSKSVIKRHKSLSKYRCRSQSTFKGRLPLSFHSNIISQGQTKKELLVNDESLLERSRTHWKIGDWKSLTQLDVDNLQNHRERAELAILAAAGHLQLGDMSKARSFIRLAQDWGCTKKLLSQILIAGVHNSLGRASALGGQNERAQRHFENAITVVYSDDSMGMLFQARANQQLEQIGQHGLYDSQSIAISVPIIDTGNQHREIKEAKNNCYICDNRENNYYINPNYKSRLKYVHYDDMEAEDKWQLEVYLHAYAIMKKYDFKKVADIGCGSAYKLITYLGCFSTIGYELPTNVEILKKRYPERDWRVSDFSSNESIDAEVIICSDVIEHLVNPDELLNYLCVQNFEVLIISTPDRELVYKQEKDKKFLSGPPRNKAHVREWNFVEFEKYIGSKFDIIKHEITNLEQGAQMIICRRINRNDIE
jgi:hypothetical protein